MSARKILHQDLNLSGFSPIKVGSSPSVRKSPAKDYGVQEAINNGRDQILAGYDKWNIACSNGSQYINQIQSIKSKSRPSSIYPTDLEIYCKKLELVTKVLEGVISSVCTFKAQIKSSINILESLNDDTLKKRLQEISIFLGKLIDLYEKSFHKKIFIIQNIAHTTSEDQSNFLVASWTDELSYLIFKLIIQLKVSPSDHQWRS